MAELCHNLLLWVWIRRNAPWKLLRARLGFNVVQIGSSNRIARHFSAIAEHKSKKTHTHTHTITRKKLPEQPVCEERNPGGGETRTAAFWERGRTAKKTHPNRRSKTKTINNDVDHGKGQRLRRDEFFWSTTPFWVTLGGLARGRVTLQVQPLFGWMEQSHLFVWSGFFDRIGVQDSMKLVPPRMSCVERLVASILGM